MTAAARQPVIAATDGSGGSLRAVEWAAREAVRRGGDLRIVSAAAPLPGLRPGQAVQETVTRAVDEAARRALDEAAHRAQEIEPSLTPVAELLDGVPSEALLTVAHDASLLVVGSRGTGGFAAMMVGSISRYLATHAPCPVVVAREETMAVHRQVVVGVRDPGQASAAIGFAFAEAELRRARLLAVQAIHWPLLPPGSPGPGDSQTAGLPEVPAETAERLDQAVAVWQRKYPSVAASWERVYAHPARVLAGASARADLVVIGRRSTGAAAVGSIVHPLLSHAHGPVAVVPGC